MRDPEYDRFGPWIYEITEEDPLPPLFVPYITRTETPAVSIKIPRKIERRDAQPGWNLYDYVLNIYDEDIQIWKRIKTRSGDKIETRTFRYSDIICLRCEEILLRGRLSIITGASSCRFEYSTVSSGIIKRVIDFLRAGYISHAESPQDFPTPGCNESGLDFYFTNLLAQERAEFPENKLLFCQSAVRLNSAEKNLLKKIFYGISSKELLESMHFCDGRELKIIGRGRSFRNIFSPSYGREEVFIPLKHIKNLTVRDRPEALFAEIVIEAENYSMSYYSMKDNPGLNAYIMALKSI